MPQWIHDRADRILGEHPEMPKSEAFAIATQQSHALGKSPKSYGTSNGRQVAKSKYRTPEDDVKTASFIDELQKIAWGVDWGGGANEEVLSLGRLLPRSAVLSTPIGGVPIHSGRSVPINYPRPRGAPPIPAAQFHGPVPPDMHPALQDLARMNDIRGFDLPPVLPSGTLDKLYGRSPKPAMRHLGTTRKPGAWVSGPMLDELGSAVKQLASSIGKKWL